MGAPLLVMAGARAVSAALTSALSSCTVASGICYALVVGTWVSLLSSWNQPTSEVTATALCLCPPSERARKYDRLNIYAKALGE
jgi:hypothetical protein